MLITLVNKEKLAMPVVLQIVQTNGKTETLHLPVEIWQRGATYTVKYPSTSPIATITLDPDSQLPDANLDNNIYKGTK